jgi:thioesterase domain-containing protein/NRPS condensation-like uncharacterized protein
MDLNNLLTELARNGIKVSSDGVNLSIRAAKGALTPELKDAIAQSKPQLIRWLSVAGQGTEDPIIPSIDRSSQLPLSLGQERLWWLIQSDPSTTIYNLPFVFQISGSLDVSIFNQCVNEIISRHEILRTTFPLVNGQPIQCLNSTSVPWNLTIIDLSQNGDSFEVDLQTEISLATQHIFDIATGPLFLIRLLKLPKPDTATLVFVFHHLVFDGWSVNLFFQELQSLYQAFMAHQPSPLPKLPIQYVDFASWQRQWLQGSVLEEKSQYWVKHLRDLKQGLQLPTHSANCQNWSAGSYLTLAIEEEETNQLKSLSLSEDISLFVTLLSALSVLLFSYTGQEDLVLCTPGACRNFVNLEKIIGYFNNLLPVRIHLSKDFTLRQVFNQVKESILGAFKNQELPFQTITDLPGVPKIPMARALFTILPNIVLPLDYPNLIVTPIDIGRTRADIDLSVTVSEFAGALKIAFEYRTSLFEEETIQSLAKHYQSVLKLFVVDPSQTLDQLKSVAGIPNWEPTEVKQPYIPPRNDLEQKLVSIWEKNLLVHPIGVKESFLSLGGTSLTAIQILGQIERDLGLSLSLPVFSSAINIEGLARVLNWGSKDPEWSPLVPLQTSGSKTPLFMGTPVSNQAFVFKNLIHYLGSDQPFYALKIARDYDVKIAEEEKLEDLAAECIQAIQKIQPQGPYRIGGYCAGATLAYEMAQQLQAMGEKVEALIIIDTPPSQKSTLFRILWRMVRARILVLTSFKFVAPESAHIVTQVKALAQQVNLYWREVIAPLQRSLKYQEKVFFKYKAQHYNGNVTLILPEIEHKIPGNKVNLGWNDYVSGKVAVYDVTGDHFTLLSEPHVQQVAQHLKQSLKDLG